MYYHSRANSKYQLEDSNGVIKDCTQAIRLDSTKSSSYYLRGLAEIEVNKVDAAYDDLRKAHELGHETALEDLQKLKPTPKRFKVIITLCSTIKHFFRKILM